MCSGGAVLECKAHTRGHIGEDSARRGADSPAERRGLARAFAPAETALKAS
jgi:hypothetical protein